MLVDTIICHCLPYTELHFLVKWLDTEQDGDIMFDVMAAKKIISNEDILDLEEGSTVKAPFQGQMYDVRILAKGM